MSEGFVKKTKISVIAALILSLIPMLIVAIYARPLADDFGYSAATRAVWLETHNIFLVLAAAGRQVAETYFDWQGSFSAIWLFALQPGLFSEKIYGLSTLILVAFFVWGNFYFFKGVFKEKSADLAPIVAGAVLIVSMQTLPHANQGFYWWNGASYYTLFYSLMLLQWGMIIRKKNFVLSCILGFIISGGNLVTGLLNLEVTALILIYVATKAVKEASEKRNAFKLLAVMAFSLGGFIVNAVAPGNAVRAAESHSMGAVEAIGKSFIDAHQYFIEWMNLPVILLLLAVLPFLWFYGGTDKDDENSLLRQIPMFVLVFIAFGLFASTFTPTEFSMSEVGPRRIQNVRFFTFIVFAVLLESEAVVRVRAFIGGGAGSFAKDKSGKVITGYFLSLAVMAIVFLGIYTIPKENRNTITSVAAARSFLIGESSAYARERDEWTRILNTEDKVVELSALEYWPVPIYYNEFDIKGDPTDYRDRSMCDYYGKDEIILLQK